jgi:hypothetical protein
MNKYAFSYCSGVLLSNNGRIQYDVNVYNTMMIIWFYDVDVDLAISY